MSAKSPYAPCSGPGHTVNLAKGAPLSRTRYKVMPMTTDTTDRILRLKAVLQRTGLCRSTMYRKMESGTFPRNVQISTRCVGWRESAIEAWLRNPMFYSVDDPNAG